MAGGLVAYAERSGHRGLIAYTVPVNAVSRRVLEKVGFTYERNVEHHGHTQVAYKRP